MPLSLLILSLALLPTCARADCVGFLNQTEQGYKLEGERLEPTGPKVSAGTELEFTGIGRFKDRMFLVRSRSDVIFDAQNVELDSKCDLQSRELPRAR